MTLKCFGVFAAAALLCAVASAQTEFKDFKLPDLDGKLRDTKTLRTDKAMVVKLGATWCGYCQLEVKELLKLRKEFAPKDLAIVDVYIMESAKTVARHAKDLPFSVLLDEKGTVGRSLGIVGIPVVLVVDTKGKTVYRGHYTPHAALRELVKRALADRAGSLAEKTTAASAARLEYSARKLASCLKCRRVKGSPGCCKTDPELTAGGLCADCGYAKGSANCCKLQGKELCPACGFVKGSALCIAQCAAQT